MANSSSYDEVLYPNYAHAQTHPDRLATLATLHGLQPANIATSRILELACGQGGNLIPLAVSYPSCTCVGIDLAERQIAQGQKVIDALELENIELRCQSILDFSDDSKPFDYIIAHGVYSWVPEVVREKILKICHDHLSPQGIAIVSYNTYPGWHQRRMIRDMMLFHSKRFSEPAKRIEQAKAFLTFMTQATGTDSAYGHSLNEEFQTLSKSDESYLFHEQLEEVNEPVYFHQFAQQLATHDLQYLCEVEQSNLQLERYPQPIAEVISKMEVIEREQYLDFFMRRTFRQTLICHRETVVNRSGMAEQIKKLRLATRIPISPPDQQQRTQSLIMKSYQGTELAIHDPLVKDAFIHLGVNWPRWIPFEELLNAARKEAGDGSIVMQTQAQRHNEEKTLVDSLTHAFIHGLIELHASEPTFATTLADNPVACPLVRYQAIHNETVISRQHSQIEINEAIRWIIGKMDGSLNLDQLAQAFEEYVSSGKISIQVEGRALADPAEIRSHLKTAMPALLQQIANLALLAN